MVDLAIQVYDGDGSEPFEVKYHQALSETCHALFLLESEAPFVDRSRLFINAVAEAIKTRNINQIMGSIMRLRQRVKEAITIPGHKCRKAFVGAELAWKNAELQGTGAVYTAMQD